MKRLKRDESLTPVQARHKRENTLLRAYFVSLFSLVLCCTMFFGTTMAWFTSDVTSGNNVITAGTIYGKMSHVVNKNANVDENAAAQVLLADVEEEDLIYIDLAAPENAEYQPFGTTPLAPTYSTEATFCVENAGDLPFSYDVYLNMEVEEEDETKNTDQKTMIDSNGEEIVITPEVLADLFNVYLVAADGSETFVGTVKELITITDEGERNAVFSGTVYPESVVREENADELASSEMFTVKIELDEEATAEIMGMKLTFNIRLVANQLLAETAEEAGETQTQN